MRFRFCVLLLTFLFIVPAPLHSQELVEDETEISKSRVVEVLRQETREIPGTDTDTLYQEIKVLVLTGSEEGNEVTIENDYLVLQEGDTFYMRRVVDSASGLTTYSVVEPYRLPALGILVALFIAIVVIFGGKQGVRALISLGSSLLFIAFFLLPGVLRGYDPTLVSVVTASAIVLIGSYLTHGFNKMTHIAVAGMITTVLATGVLAYVAIDITNLSGITDDAATYLNLNTRGGIDFAGLLLGAILIGLLGVLYDAAIGQSVAVEELTAAAPDLSRREIYRRGLRIGREHIGALVNTLAIAYVGAALPLLLWFYSAGNTDIFMILNRELFASEIVRIVVGSIGVVLVVPITTLLATRYFVKRTV
ncbi:YibE/F family protein [Candidatus Kaiserbacteria bacterium]|nr:YibE/F family protein [Candidatus Kaiserbacteria bacterium]